MKTYYMKEGRDTIYTEREWNNLSRTFRGTWKPLTAQAKNKEEARRIIYKRELDIDI